MVLSLQNPPKALGHGYRVDARVTVLARPNALLLPVESLIRTAQGWRAWVLTDGEHRMVTAGLTENDAVVLRPPPGLVAGQRVNSEAAGK